LSAGAELGGVSDYLRFLIRITADAGTSILDKHIRIQGL
jgi:hypothetical protein